MQSKREFIKTAVMASMLLAAPAICIAQDTDRYLAHRYGENWRKPDPTYNQQGTWKKSKARPRLRLNTLPLPKKIEVFDDNVYSR